jgi:CheY-like chemotaxis protein
LSFSPLASLSTGANLLEKLRTDNGHSIKRLIGELGKEHAMKNTAKTLFIIEDDEHVLAMMKTYFEYLGYRIITASDGMEGLKMLDSEQYDLVITDIVMPYVSGVGIVSVVKEKSPDIPVVAITAYGKNPERLAAEKHADVVLRKPFEMEKLKDHVARLLSGKPET